MAGRCTCDSSVVTGCAAVGISPITVTGAGTPASPFDIGLASGYLIPITCTSTTRPAGPGIGQIIFESNTLQMRVWTGTAWRLVSPLETQVHVFEGAGMGPVHPAGGARTLVCSGTVSSPVAGERFLVEVSAELWIAGLAGETWDVIINGPSGDTATDRVTIGSTGAATGTPETCWFYSDSGADVLLQLIIANYAGSVFTVFGGQENQIIATARVVPL